MWTPAGELRPNLPTLLSPLWLQQPLTVAGGGRCFWRRLDHVPLPEEMALPGELRLLPPQALLWDLGITMPSFPSRGSPTETGIFEFLIPVSLITSQYIFPIHETPAQHTLPPGGFGDRSPLSRPESHRDHFPLSLTSGNPVNLQEAVGGMREQPSLWGAEMGTDLSLGHLREPQTEGKSRETAAAPSSLSSSSRTEVHRRERM